MFRQVLIVNGKLCVGSLDYQLSHSDGSPFLGSFRGTAWFDSEKVILGDVSTAIHLNELFVARAPTRDSVEWTEGYEHGGKQRRQVWPNGKSERFVEGWKSAWKDRGLPARDFVEHNGRVVKWSTVKRLGRCA